MLAYNERSGVEINATFYDSVGTPTLPATVEYRVDCATTLKALLGWTTATVTAETNPAGEVVYSTVIEIPGSVNAIQTNRNRQEVKNVLIVADRDRTSEYSQEYSYVVRNVQGRS